MGKSAANMEDLADARLLIAEIGGVDATYTMLAKVARHWTHRRVRALWNGEAAGIRFHEMLELAQARADAQELANARKQHAAYIAKAARLARALELKDADFYRPDIDALGWLPR